MQPHSLRNLQVLLHRRLVRSIHICGPLRSVGVRRPSESREEIELEVVMGVDQSRQQQMPGEVQFESAFEARIKRKDAAAFDHQVDAFGISRAQADAGAA